MALNRIDAAAHVILAATAMGPDRSGPMSRILPGARVRAGWAALTALSPHNTVTSVPGWTYATPGQRRKDCEGCVVETEWSVTVRF